MDKEDRHDHTRGDDVQQDHEGRDAVDGLHAFIWALGALEDLVGNDRADPVPVQHDMDENAEGKQAERRELDVPPLVVRESKKRPPGGKRGRWQDELKSSQFPGEQEKRRQDGRVDPQVHDGHGNTPLAAGSGGGRLAGSLGCRGFCQFHHGTGFYWSCHRLDFSIRKEFVVGPSINCKCTIPL